MSIQTYQDYLRSLNSFEYSNPYLSKAQRAEERRIQRLEAYERLSDEEKQKLAAAMSYQSPVGNAEFTIGERREHRWDWVQYCQKHNLEAD